MTVNGQEICHWAECMPFNGRNAKRSQASEISPAFDFPDVRNYDFPMSDDSMAV